MKQYTILLLLITFHIHGMETTIQPISQQDNITQESFWGHISSYIFPTPIPYHSSNNPANVPIQTNNTHLHVYINQETRQDNQLNPTITTHAQAHAMAQANASNFLQNFNEYAEHSGQFFVNNKWQLCAAGLLASYAYLCYQVIKGNLYLQRTYLWSNWKAPLSLQELCQLPQKDLTQALLFTIQNKYISPTNPLDTGASLAQFMHEIEAERQQLEYYKTLYGRIEKTHTTWLFPLSAPRYKTIRQRLDKLAFIKHTFVTWLAEQKIKDAPII